MILLFPKPESRALPTVAFLVLLALPAAATIQSPRDEAQPAPAPNTHDPGQAAAPAVPPQEDFSVQPQFDFSLPPEPSWSLVLQIDNLAVQSLLIMHLEAKHEPLILHHGPLTASDLFNRAAGGTPPRLSGSMNLAVSREGGKLIFKVRLLCDNKTPPGTMRLYVSSPRPRHNSDAEIFSCIGHDGVTLLRRDVSLSPDCM